MAIQHWPRQFEPRQCGTNRSKNSYLRARGADHRFFRPPQPLSPPGRKPMCNLPNAIRLLIAVAVSECTSQHKKPGK